MTGKKEKNMNRKILIIDDNLDLLHSLEEEFALEGYTVITASDGFEGIKKNKASAPELILLDLKMPKMDGIETLRNIRKTSKEVIVIILTAYGSAETARKAADLNVHEYITKPFDLDVIKGAVEEALATRRKKEDE